MSLISHGTNRGAGAPLWRVFLLLAAAATAAVLVWPVRAQQQGNTEAELSPELVAQIEAIMAEKAQWTEAQQKVSSHLLQAQKIQRGEPIADGVVLRESPVDVESGGMVTVDVRADVTPAVLERIEDLGGSVVNSVSRYDAIRADLPLAALEALAELDAVQSIRPADLAFTKGRAQRLEATAGTAERDPAVTRKVNVSEGDTAHLADQARRRYRVDGSGIGIGVLSDGVDSLAERQASGDLPAAVTVLPDQEGEGDEGTAMLEIVHDLAPGARLFFATAFGGQAQFAANIEALCDAGADVIVDDIAYFRRAGVPGRHRRAGRQRRGRQGLLLLLGGGQQRQPERRHLRGLGGRLPAGTPRPAWPAARVHAPLHGHRKPEPDHWAAATTTFSSGRTRSERRQTTTTCCCSAHPTARGAGPYVPCRTMSRTERRTRSNSSWEQPSSGWMPATPC